MLLFFKGIYRAPILSGEKTDTVRMPKRLPAPGAIMQACVGPSRIFAALAILSVEPISALSPERAAQVIACYGAIDPAMVLIRFELLHEIHPKNNHHHSQSELAFGLAAQPPISDREAK